MAYSDKQVKEAKEIIIQGMIDGNSLVSVIKNNPEIPRIVTVFNWLNSESNYYDEEFLYNYARAQEIRAEREFEEIKSISDSIDKDIMITEDGKEIINHSVIQRDRLRVDARKWRISKMQPKKYGDKLDLTTDGKGLKGSNIIITKEEAKRINDALDNDY